MKNILVLTTGGTIASRKRGRVTSAEMEQQLQALVPELECRIEPVCQLGSSQITLDIMWDLVQRIRNAADHVQGIVITHGTDTMEETAFFLDQVIESSFPVVLTGSMRAADMPGFDGWANLRDACRAAARSGLSPYGVTVLMAGQLHAASHVAKVHSRCPDAFASPGAGPIALVEPGHWQWLHGPLQRKRESFQQALGPVELVKLTADASPELVKATGTYARGVVVEGLGDGHAPAPVLGALEALVSHGFPVVMTSRCLAGGASRRMNHLIYTDLAGPKARLLLMLALSLGTRWPDAFAPYRTA